MSNAHPIPLKIKDAVTGLYHDASPEDYEVYKMKHRANYTKWLNANRIAYAKQLLSEGECHNVAWAKAFERYPATQTNRPRFSMSP